VPLTFEHLAEGDWLWDQ